ncbi:hypothetical protein Sjap_022166 [Stephania japonica]|uniref:Uncharacterized protein n=1 Tax=Stephania japonica TaxID=461633 RepID=A0AAP0EX57_9MAGN
MPLENTAAAIPGEHRHLLPWRAPLRDGGALVWGGGFAYCSSSSLLPLFPCLHSSDNIDKTANLS